MGGRKPPRERVEHEPPLLPAELRAEAAQAGDELAQNKAEVWEREEHEVAAQADERAEDVDGAVENCSVGGLFVGGRARE